MEWDFHEILSIKKLKKCWWDVTMNNWFTHGSKVDYIPGCVSRISRANPLTTGVTAYLLTKCDESPSIFGSWFFWVLDGSAHWHEIGNPYIWIKMESRCSWCTSCFPTDYGTCFFWISRREHLQETTRRGFWQDPGKNIPSA